METRMCELIEDAIRKNGSAKRENKVAVAVLGGMQDDTKSVEVVVQRVTAKVRRYVCDRRPALENLTA